MSVFNFLSTKVERDETVKTAKEFVHSLIFPRFGNGAGISTLLLPHWLVQVAKTSSGLSLSLSG